MWNLNSYVGPLERLEALQLWHSSLHPDKEQLVTVYLVWNIAKGEDKNIVFMQRAGDIKEFWVAFPPQS